MDCRAPHHVECWDLHGGCSTCGYATRSHHTGQPGEADALEPRWRSPRRRSARVPWLRWSLALGVSGGTLLALAALVVAFATQPLAVDVRVLLAAAVTAVGSLAYSARWGLGATRGYDPASAFDTPLPHG